MSNPIYCRMQYVRIYHCTNVLWDMRTTLDPFGWLMIMNLWSDDICHVVDLENMIHHHHQLLRINNKTTTILLAIYHHSKQIFILCIPSSVALQNLGMKVFNKKKKFNESIRRYNNFNLLWTNKREIKTLFFMTLFFVS